MNPEDPTWNTLFLSGVLCVVMGYLFLRFDVGGSRARIKKRIADSRGRPWYMIELYRPHVFLGIGVLLMILGVIVGVVSLLG